MNKKQFMKIITEVVRREVKKAFDTSKMSEMMGYGKSDDMKRDMVAVDTIKKAGRSVDQVPEHVTNALTRDYSGLMKAIEKKKGA